MKNQITYRLFSGFPLGITISLTISIMVSLIIQDGYFHACPPALIDTMSSELSAVIVQTLLSGVLGSALSVAALVWNIEHWSIAKQTGVYFFISSLAITPIAYLNHWMQHSLIGFFSFYLFFVGIFLVVWIVQYLFLRKKIRSLNQKVR